MGGRQEDQEEMRGRQEDKEEMGERQENQEEMGGRQEDKEEMGGRQEYHKRGINQHTSLRYNLKCLHLSPGPVYTDKTVITLLWSFSLSRPSICVSTVC